MGLILDSSIVIASEREGQTAFQMLETFGRSGNQEIAVSVITVLEFVHGIARAQIPAQRERRQRFLDDLLSGMPIHPVTIPIALRAGRIDGLLQSQGKRVPIPDLLIGATALELGYSVATHNLRHFELIPSLQHPARIKSKRGEPKPAPLVQN